MKGSEEEATKPREYCPPTPPQVHPWSRASFCLFLDRGGEKEALLKSRQAFEVAAARTSGLVSLVSLVKLFECKHLFIDKLMIITERTAIKPGVETISQ